MKAKEKKEFEHELQVLVIQFNRLYAGHLIGIGRSNAHLDEEAFDALALPDSIVGLREDNHFSAYTKNGLRITTVRD